MCQWLRDLFGERQLALAVTLGQEYCRASTVADWAPIEFALFRFNPRAKNAVIGARKLKEVNQPVTVCQQT
jgi:hypothetical protein